MQRLFQPYVCPLCVFAVLLTSVAGFSVSSQDVEPVILFDTNGFEAANDGGYLIDESRLIGQDGWSAVEGKHSNLTVSKNRKLSGQASVRSSSKSSAAIREIAVPAISEPSELVIRVIFGNPTTDDKGIATVSLLPTPNGEPLIQLQREGNSDSIRAVFDQSSPAISSRAKLDAKQSVFMIEAVLRLEADRQITAASVRVQEPGSNEFHAMALAPGNPAPGGFYPATGDLSSDSLYLHLAVDCPNFKNSIRVDDLSVALRPVADATPIKLLAGSAPPKPLIQDMPVTRNVYPASAGVVDVTQPPYNAKGDGKTDDTAAIQAALSLYPSGNRIIFLPDGEYLVSDTLRWPETQRAQNAKRTTLEGESREGTVIRLIDRAPDYQDPENRKAVVWTGDRPAQRFRNKVRNLTINTGRGNPGASGLQFNTSNAGHVMNVTIRSEDGRGAVGLDLAHTSEVGNLYGANIEVIGFDDGIRTRDSVNGVFLENITLRNQKRHAILNDGQVLAARSLVSMQPSGAKTLVNREKRGVVSLIETTITGGVDMPVLNDKDGILYVRDLTTDAPRRAIRNDVANSVPAPPAASVEEYASQRAAWADTQGRHISLRLPIQDAPFPPRDPASEWANVQDFGAVGDGETDDTAAIQKAIDSGATTVLMPAGRRFRVNQELVLRGNLRHLIGTNAWVSGAGSFRVVDGEADLVLMEGIEFRKGGDLRDIIVDTARAFHLFDCKVPGIRITSPGPVFITDVTSHMWNKRKAPVLRLDHPDAELWCRNFNPEVGGQSKILMKSGTLWCLGYKTENHGTVLEMSGGTAELIGTHVYAQGAKKQRAAIELSGDARLTLAGWRQYTFKPTWFNHVIGLTGPAGKVVLERSATPFNGIPLLTIGPER
ncbi:MAG: glycosyl hydrolase family 28-related protein [Planctomycetota bacterium]